MKENVKILAILHIVLGLIGAGLGLLVLAMMGGVAAMITSSDPGVPAGIIGLVLTCFGVWMLATTLPGIIGGFGLLSGKPWARTVIIVVSVMDLINFPLGTALGIYGLIVLMNERTKLMFEPA